MNYDVKTVDEYFNKLEMGWRKDIVVELHEYITNYDDKIEVTIEYKMLAYKKNDKTILYINAQKNYVSIYSYFDKVDKDRNILVGYSQSKGCIRVKKKIGINAELIKYLNLIIQAY